MLDREVRGKSTPKPVDDDGNYDRLFRQYRYVCRCGKTGTWQPSVVAARGDFDVHRSDMAEGKSP